MGEVNVFANYMWPDKVVKKLAKAKTDEERLEIKDKCTPGYKFVVESLLTLLTNLGYEDPTISMAEQMLTMMSALEIFQERDKRYKGLWRGDGAMDSAMHVHSKAARVRQAGLDGPPAALDDAHDIINYAAFYIRNAQEGNYG